MYAYVFLFTHSCYMPYKYVFLSSMGKRLCTIMIVRYELRRKTERKKTTIYNEYNSGDEWWLRINKQAYVNQYKWQMEHAQFCGISMRSVEWTDAVLARRVICMKLVPFAWPFPRCRESNRQMLIVILPIVDIAHPLLKCVPDSLVVKLK